MTEPFLETHDLCRTFHIGKNRLDVLKNVSLRLDRGEALSVTGASGAGKSTLLHILGALDRPSSGTVLLGGRDLYALPARLRTRIRAERIGFVFQAYHLLPELDVLENVLLPAATRRFSFLTRGRSRERAMNLLRSVGLAERAAHLPNELSGGEQQRVALARALMNEPEIIFADEPTGNLDSRTGAQVLDCLFDLTVQRGHSLLLVSHDRDVATRCTRTLELVDGRMA